MGKSAAGIILAIIITIVTIPTSLVLNGSSNRDQKNTEGRLVSDSPVYILTKGADYFPQPNDELKLEERSDYWGFNPDLKKIYGNNECNKKSFSSTKKKNEGNSITNWSKNFKKWFNNQMKISKKDTWTNQNQQ